MEDYQRKAIAECMEKLSKDINYVRARIYLKQKTALDATQIELIEGRATTTIERNIELLQHLQVTDKGWNRLIDCLNSIGQTNLVDMLVAQIEKGGRKAAPKNTGSSAAANRPKQRTLEARQRAYNLLKKNGGTAGWFYLEGLSEVAERLVIDGLLNGTNAQQVEHCVGSFKKVCALCDMLLARQDVDDEFAKLLAECGMEIASSAFLTELDK